MRDESELREIRAEVVAKLEELDGTGDDDEIVWQKLESAEVALDYALGENDILDNILDDL
jgi:hypothetical protein